MRQKIDFADRVAVIIGAAGGIGLALATRAALHGMKVVMVDRDPERLAIAFERMGEKNSASIAVHMDTSNLAAVRKLAQRIEVELGAPWLVCNVCESSSELHVQGVTHSVEVFAPLLADRGEGHIVNIIAADFLGSGGPAVCAAALHAILGLSKLLYRELDSSGSRVGVSLVCPAQSDTDIRILAIKTLNCTARPVRSRVGETLRPESIAEEVFGAIRTRRFWVFSNGSETSGCVTPVNQRCEPAFIGPELKQYA